MKEVENNMSEEKKEENKKEIPEKPVVAPPMMEFRLDRVLKLEVSPDRLQAAVRIKPGFLMGHSLTESDIFEFLTSSKINQDRIDFKDAREALKILEANLAAGKMDEFTFNGARGLLPLKGIDGWMKSDKPLAKRVKLNPDGSVDYRNIDRYIHVKKDENICTMFEGVPGHQGMDVFGVPIPPSPIIRAKMKVGRNVNVKQENYPEETEFNDLKVKVFFSATEGVLYLTESSVSVSSELVIDKNVGLETGNINYEGTVVVKGNVEDGTIVNCKGSLIVGGSVETDELLIEENLEVKGGIRTKGKHVLRVHGDLTAKFIENTILEVDGDIILEGAIIHSKINCLGNVVLNGDSGNIISSTVVAYGNISLKNLGSVSEGDVTVELGYHFKNDRSSKMLIEHLKIMEAELEHETQEINKIKQVIQRSRGNIEPEKKAEYKKIFEDYTEKSNKAKLLAAKLEEIKNNRFNSEPVHLIARGGAFPGSTVKYRSQVDKFSVFESSFSMNFFPGQEQAIRSGIKPH